MLVAKKFLSWFEMKHDASGEVIPPGQTVTGGDEFTMRYTKIRFLVI